ncbi:unnamed protein product [Oppiella nova]|uniref:Protein kinase domain-containing protein n=1 Tax=Oppiella nova TaxID=334625 RepID=A0A7R9MJF2_9ACAR|nr:unnamed protein product [Oppiella nova]CAG2178499.1 unnamed protein product [Oppiella nova]
MNSIEFYISCHIFKEILECVQYLHELDPPIIHRDLKPDNVLVAQEVKNIHDRDFYTVTGQQSGAPVYQAPEVTSGSPQSYSSDNEVLNKCVIKLWEVLVSMALYPNWEDRPECKDVLKTYHDDRKAYGGRDERIM